MRMFGLLQHHPAVTIKQLLELVEKHDRTTVYRNIDLFERLGIITRLQLGWHTKLELSDIFHHHHHHMTCVKCGKVTILRENPELEHHIAILSKRARFKPTDHQLEIRGLCQTCQKAN